MRIYFNLVRDSCWDEVNPGKSKAKNKTLSGGIQWRIQGGARGPAPLYFQTKLSPLPPPPPLLLSSYLKVFIRHWNGIFKYYEQDIKQFNFYCCCVLRLPSFSSYIVHNRGLMQMFYCDITQLCVIRTSRESDHINTNEEHLAITNGRKI